MCSPAASAPGPSPANPASIVKSVIDEARGLSVDELGERIGALAAHLAAAMCRWLLLVAEFDARGGHAEQGAKTCVHWLSWCCGIGERAAREHVRVARRLRELPLICEAFAAGEISYSKVRALTRVASERTEQSLLTIARHATGAQMERLARRYSGVLRASADSARSSHQRRELHCDWLEDGSLSVRARLPAEDGALLLAALKAAQAQQPQPDEEAQLVPEQPTARRADALAAIARAALAAGEAPRSGGDPCEMVVHIDLESLRSDQTHERCELEHGPALAPETARRLGCDAALAAIVEQDGKPLSVGRRTRSIPPALRRALRCRDGGRCAFPGCEHSRFLHAHHIQHWARGGHTELQNLIQLCSAHHRLVHEGGFQVRRTQDGGATFHRPDGRPIPAAGPPRRPGGNGLERQNTTHGLRLNGDSCRPRSAGEQLDYGLAVCGLTESEVGQELADGRRIPAPQHPRPPTQASL
jgi:hypothetical protein